MRRMHVDLLGTIQSTFPVATSVSLSPTRLQKKSKPRLAKRNRDHIEDVGVEATYKG